MTSSRFEIFHNPRCTKSRQTLQRLRDAGIEPTITEYLTSPPTADRLRTILGLLGLDDARALMRTQEAPYAELGLANVDATEALLDAMAVHPILIERPIVVRDETRAVIGRPPENIDALLTN